MNPPNNKLNRFSSSINNQKRVFHTNIASAIPVSSMVSQNQNFQSTSPTFVPSQHIPKPSEPSGFYQDLLISDSDMALTKKRFIKVSSTGEIEVEPDLIEFCVQITTSRSDITEGRESIKKREDYILAVLKKCQIRDKDIISSVIVRKRNEEDLSEEPLRLDLQNECIIKQNKQSNPKEDAEQVNKTKNPTEGLKLIKELCVKCDSLMKYMQIYSICNEKLDHHVNVSQPIVRFSPDHIQTNTQKALKLANTNGILKAKELITTTQKRHSVVIGKLFYSMEDSLSIQNIQDYDKVLSSKFETFSWRRRNKIIKCNLISVYELEQPRKIRSIV